MAATGGARAGGGHVCRAARAIGGARGCGAGTGRNAAAASAWQAGQSAQGIPCCVWPAGAPLPDPTGAPAWQIGTSPKRAVSENAAEASVIGPRAIWPSNASMAMRRPRTEQRGPAGCFGLIRAATIARPGVMGSWSAQRSQRSEQRGCRLLQAQHQPSGPCTKHMIPSDGVQHTTARPVGLSERLRIFSDGTVSHRSPIRTS